jgi:hypothetical protein
MTRDNKFNFDFTFKSNKCINIKNFEDCIYCKNKDIEIKMLKKKIKDNDDKVIKLEEYINRFISFSQNYNINNIDELKKFIIKKMEPIDDLIYIDYDVFQYESTYSLEKQIEDYEGQLDTIDTFLKSNNINNFSEFKTYINKSDFNNNYINNKYNNINMILENVNIKNKSQILKMDELICKYEDLNVRIKSIKNKINNFPINRTIMLNGVKKVLKRKNEKTINKINMLEKEFNEYCDKQILWAKDVLGDKYSSDNIIRLLDIYNKLNNDEKLSSSDSENEVQNKYYNILNKNKKGKILEFESYIELGKDFIDNDINSRKNLTNDNLIFIKEIMKTSDLKFGSKDEKINRFINQCKRYYILSQKIKNIDNIIKSKLKTDIRDISNKDFDSLLILLDNNINKNN